MSVGKFTRANRSDSYKGHTESEHEIRMTFQLYHGAKERCLQPESHLECYLFPGFAHMV